MMGEDSPRYQFRLLTKDLRTKWFELSGVKIEWEGRPATLDFITDITERKQTELFNEIQRKILKTLYEKGRLKEVMKRVISILIAYTGFDVCSAYAGVLINSLIWD